MSWARASSDMLSATTDRHAGLDHLEREVEMPRERRRVRHHDDEVGLGGAAAEEGVDRDLLVAASAR